MDEIIDIHTDGQREREMGRERDRERGMGRERGHIERKRKAVLPRTQ